MVFRRIANVALAAIGGLAAVVGTVGAPAPSAGAAPVSAPPLATGPYPAAYVTAMRNAFAMKSFHEVQTIVSKGWRSVNSEDAVINGGAETDTISASGAQFGFTARLFNGHLYLNADQETLVTVVNLSSFNGGFNAGHWLVVPQSAKVYSEFAFGIDVQTGIAQIELGAPITIGKRTTFLGRSVVPLTSRTALHASVSAGIEQGQFTLYTSTGPHPLPVAEVIKDTINKLPQTVTIVFSRWNRPVTVTRPASFRPLP